MDTTHLHLLLNHFPIIGTLIGLGIMLYGYTTDSEAVKKAALWLWVIMAVVAVPVFLTGEPAEESVEDLAGVSEAMIHEHEEAAELAIWLMAALGVLALGSLILTYKKAALAKSLLLIATLLSLATFGSMARTGYLGGQIRHSEIRSGQSSTSGEQQDDSARREAEDDED